MFSDLIEPVEEKEEYTKRMKGSPDMMLKDVVTQTLVDEKGHRHQ